MYRKSGLSIQSFIPLKKEKEKISSYVLFISLNCSDILLIMGEKNQPKPRVICITHFYMFYLMSAMIWGY